MDLSWMDDGACRLVPDRDRLFFAGSRVSDAARAVCNSCPVITPCLEHALSTDVEGVWAATSKAERSRIRLERNIVPFPLPLPSLSATAEMVS